MSRLLLNPRAVAGPDTNPLYPLPPDYGELRGADAARARLEALCRQQTPDSYVYVWAFWRREYLMSMPQGLMYPELNPSPPMHYQMTYDIARHRYNAFAAPRGFAKSTVIMENMMLQGVTRPYEKIFLLLSGDVMCARRMTGTIIPVLEQCERLNSDLVACGFPPVPPRGRARKWNTHEARLSNMATIEARAVKGAVLGYRPQAIYADDVEYDPKLRQINPELTENYQQFFTHTIIPMLGVSLGMICFAGTLLSQQCFLFYVCNTKDDPRLASWNRRIFDAEDDGKGELLWPDRFSREELDKRKEDLGPAAYNAQLRNQPGVEDVRTLHIIPERNEYDVVGPRPEDSPNPFALPDTMMVSHVSTGADQYRRIERPFSETVSRMYRCLLMDWAACLSPTSDYIAMPVIGIENSRDYHNTWWVLDLAMGRWPNNSWLPILYRLAAKWRVSFIGIEAVAAQTAVVSTAQDYADRMGLTDWMPRPLPVKYPSVTSMSKEDRISGLIWRFESGKIKLPTWRKHSGPIGELYYEIRGFTGQPGATQKDDALDAVAMLQFAIKGGTRRVIEPQRDPAHSFRPLELLEQGIDFTEGGLAVASGLTANDIPMHIIHKRMAERMQEAYNRRQRPVLSVL